MGKERYLVFAAKYWVSNVLSIPIEILFLILSIKFFFVFLDMEKHAKLMKALKDVTDDGSQGRALPERDQSNPEI